MPALVKQPAGLGDILFTHKIAHRLAKKYGKVYWPVIPEYSWLQDYIGTKEIFYCQKEDVPAEEIEFGLDLENAGRVIHDVSCMDAKYLYASRYDLVPVGHWDPGWYDYHNWQQYLSPCYQHSQVQGLIDHLMADGHGSAVVGRTFASPPNSQAAPIPNITHMPVIELRPIPGFTPFDWVYILSSAEEIHLVDTCFTFLLDIWILKAKVVNIYSRNYGDNSAAPSWKQTRHLFRKRDQWNWLH